MVIATPRETVEPIVRSCIARGAGGIIPGSFDTSRASAGEFEVATMIRSTSAGVSPVAPMIRRWFWYSQLTSSGTDVPPWPPAVPTNPWPAPSPRTGTRGPSR